MIRRTLVAFGLAALAAACGRNDKQADPALSNDLNLAAQQQPGNMDSISALENGYANAPAASTPSTSRSTTTTHRSTSSGSVSHRSSGSSGTYSSRSSGSSSGSVSTGTQGSVTVKHTKRDAAIGAAAGAVIGATTSKDKVKGGIIGAAVGGILGGVIGNNVDKSKKPPR